MTRARREAAPSEHRPTGPRPAEAPASVRGEGFPPSLRVRKRWEYRRVQTGGRRVHGHRFVWIVMPRDDRRPGAEGAGGAGEAGGTGGAARGARGPARLGTVVTKKVAGGAVQRVRVKRLLREAFRRHRALLPAGADVVAVAKEAAVAATFEDVAAELRSVAPELARLAKAGPRPPRGSGR